MTHSGDAAEQIVRISLDGIEYALKITGAGVKNIASVLMALAKSKNSHPTNLKISGSERMKRMIKSRRPLDIFSVKERDLSAFVKEAKKYGIVYCAVRDKKPKADGMVDFYVCKDDAPKINRVVELLEYGSIDKASIKSEIVKTRAENGAEPSVPDKSDTLDVDSFLDEIMPDEGKSKEGQNQAVQPPVPEKSSPEAGEPMRDFFSNARTKPNPSEHGLEDTNNRGKSNSDVNEYGRSSYSSSRDEQVVDVSSRGVHPPSVKDEINQIRGELKEKAQKRRDEPQLDKSSPQQTTRHQQPQPTRKSKSKNGKER